MTKIDIERHMLNIQKKLNCIFYFSKKNHHTHKHAFRRITKNGEC